MTDSDRLNWIEKYEPAITRGWRSSTKAWKWHIRFDYPVLGEDGIVTSETRFMVAEEMEGTTLREVIDAGIKFTTDLGIGLDW